LSTICVNKKLLHNVTATVKTQLLNNYANNSMHNVVQHALCLKVGT